MTPQAIQGYIRLATHALDSGHCDVANEHIDAGYEAMQDYAAALAQIGHSPALTLNLQKKLAKLRVRAAKLCAGRGDSLIAPSFSGPGEGGISRPVVGFAIGALLLAGGLFATYKHS